jgi:integrase
MFDVVGRSNALYICEMPIRLTVAQIERLQPGVTTRDISDAAAIGLVLRIAANGAKYWLFRFKLKGNGTRISLGAFPAVKLSQARALALEYRQQLECGIDPRRARRVRRRQPAALHAYLPDSRMSVHPAPSPQSRQAIQRNPQHDKHSVNFLVYEYVEGFIRANHANPEYVIRILEKDVLSEWAGRDARTIKPRDVVQLLEKIVQRGSPIMANRTASLLGQMFRYGTHRAIVDDSPVRLLFRPGGKEKSRRRVLSEAELVAFINRLSDACPSKAYQHALMLLLLTLQRRSELCLAEWSEFDFNERAWRIPDAHAKNRRGHIVPLTDWAIAELQGLRELAAGSRFVLPNSTKTGPANPRLITGNVARSLHRFRRIGIAAFTPHDLRRTARTELARIGVPKHVAERLLNHSKESVEGTYTLYEYMDEKRLALELWEMRLLQLKSLTR